MNAVRFWISLFVVAFGTFVITAWYVNSAWRHIDKMHRRQIHDLVEQNRQLSKRIQGEQYNIHWIEWNKEEA